MHNIPRHTQNPPNRSSHAQTNTNQNDKKKPYTLCSLTSNIVFFPRSNRFFWPFSKPLTPSPHTHSHPNPPLPPPNMHGPRHTWHRLGFACWLRAFTRTARIGPCETNLKRSRPSRRTERLISAFLETHLLPNLPLSWIRI